MHRLLSRIRDFLASLRLTVLLLIAAMVLVFASTLDQMNLGIWEVQEKYFRSFFVLWRVPGTPLSLPVFPGGYFLGAILLLNLTCSQLHRFGRSWKHIGIYLTHAGLVLLLVGELLSGLSRQDRSMRLIEGVPRNYSESFRDYELALVDRSHPDHDLVVVFPEVLLKEGAVLQNPLLPFTVRVRRHFANATLQPAPPPGAASPSESADRGFGQTITLLPTMPGQGTGEADTPGAYLEIDGPRGSEGTWLVSPLLVEPQTVSYPGHPWEISLRLRRAYAPYSLTLLEATHDVYPGTSIPKNFSSRVRLRSADGAEDREAVISMNHPLRYGGSTYYQYQMNAPAKMSVLEVVHNPSWRLPYIACALMAVGLTLQFCQSLVGYLWITKKEGSFPEGLAIAPKATLLDRLIPISVVLLGLFFALAGLRTPVSPRGFDLSGIWKDPGSP